MKRQRPYSWRDVFRPPGGTRAKISTGLPARPPTVTEKSLRACLAGIGGGDKRFSMHFFGEAVSGGNGFFLILAVLLALGFECVNGFHDTANAVATVIYTHSLKPWVAVVWSGVWNLIGVLVSTGGVAYGVVALLPVELVLHVGSAAGFAMVFALLISAILWNLGTWYMGLPASSSHSLIGAIVGVGLANSMMQSGHAFGEGVNWGKVRETFTALLISPVIGFVCAGGLLLLLKALVKQPDLYQAPEGEQPPKLWVRSLLVLTCTGVSFAHGSNDGQKGQGLLMLILIGVLPGAYALKMDADPQMVQSVVMYSQQAADGLSKKSPGVTISDDDAEAVLAGFIKSDGKFDDKTFAAVAQKAHGVHDMLDGKKSLGDVPIDSRRAVRTNLYLVGGALGKLAKMGKFTDPKEKEAAANYGAEADKLTRYIPLWVKVAVAFALGLGTMVGWKRIVVTVGEKIGKSHLTYGQGASAELVAMGTILAADHLNLPVSTTHILSSGVAGTMAANHAGLQKDTLRNILLAWVLTLPVCVLLGAGLFAFGLFLVFNVFGLH